LEAPKQVDHLSRLPPELLRHIFRSVEVDHLPRPLSRFLKPFQDEVKFEAVEVDSYDTLHQLMNVVAINGEVGGFIKALSFDLDEDEEKSVAGLAGFFSSLINLRSLSLIDAPPVISLVLKPAFANIAFPLLEDLDINFSFSRRLHPFHPRHFEALSSYTSLVRFTLRIDRDFEDYADLPSLPSSSWSQHFSHLKGLALTGVRLDTNALGVILSGCEKLRSLALQDGSGLTDTVGLVEKLPRVSTLRQLTLNTFDDDEDPPLRSITSLLAKVPRLTSLNILGPDDVATPAFLEILYALPLVELSFGCNTPLVAEHVFSLLDPRTRHPTLQRLNLHNVYALRGPHIYDLDEDELEENYLDERGEVVMHDDWLSPLWPEDESWTPAIVEQIRDAAERAGVEVTGTTFEAAQIEKEYDEEAERVKEFWEERAEQEAIDWEYENYFRRASDEIASE
jgi:hypothetical protein